jgi:hypothetical protein
MTVEISELRRVADAARDHQKISRVRDYCQGVEDALRWAAGDAVPKALLWMIEGDIGGGLSERRNEPHA